MKKLFLSFFVAVLALAGTTAHAQDVQVDMSEAEAITPENQIMVDQIVDLSLSDPEKANKVIQKLLAKTKKSIGQTVSVGKYFVEKGVTYYGAARMFSQQAYTVAPTNVLALKLNVAVALMRKDAGAAGQKVDEILMQDENNIEALRLAARVYKYVNPYVAIEKLEKIMELEPNNLNASRELGDIYYHMDEHKKAIEYYATYFTNTPAAELNILSTEQYCYSLIATNNWETLSKVASVAEPIKTDDVVFKRARFYSDIETYKESSAVESVKYITEKYYGDSIYIYRDYAYAAEYAKNNDDYESAIEYYKKGIAIDAKQLSAYQQVASLYRRLKKIDEALEYYNKYMELKGDKADLSDERGLLQIYTAAQKAASTMEEKMDYVEKGDVIAQRICAERPDSYQGPYYRAQLWILEPSKPEAKPLEYYKKALELLGDNVEYSSYISVAATYCAFYYLQITTNDTPKEQELINNAESLKYAELALKFDEDNTTAKQIKKFLSPAE